MVHTHVQIQTYVRTYTVYTQATCHIYLHKRGYMQPGWGAATTTAINYVRTTQGFSYIFQHILPCARTSQLVHISPGQEGAANLHTWVLRSTAKWWCSASCTLGHATYVPRMLTYMYPHLTFREMTGQHVYHPRNWSTATTWHNTEWMNTDSTLYAQFGSYQDQCAIKVAIDRNPSFPEGVNVNNGTVFHQATAQCCKICTVKMHRMLGTIQSTACTHVYIDTVCTCVCMSPTFVCTLQTLDPKPWTSVLQRWHWFPAMLRPANTYAHTYTDIHISSKIQAAWTHAMSSNKNESIPPPTHTRPDWEHTSGIFHSIWFLSTYSWISSWRASGSLHTHNAQFTNIW